MYDFKCKIMVLSGNSFISDAVKNADAMEDCDFEVSFPDDIDTICDLGDSAIIIDAFDAVNANLARFQEAYKVVVVPYEAADEFEDIIKIADAVWTEPAYASVARALYERLCKDMKLRFDMRMTDTCLKTAIDSIPDLVWFKDDKGRHLMVNDGFCKAVDKTKSMIYKQGHYYIWDMPEEEYEKGDYVCLESEEIVMRARQTVLFDEKVKTKMGMKLFKTYKSPLIDSDGTIFGTCGVAHDVTDLKNINIELDAVLNSMPFTVIVEGEKRETVSVNPKFAEYFPECGDAVGRPREYWQHSAESLTTLENGMTELVVKTAEGKKLLRMEENVIYDSFGETIGEVFVLRDITAEHKFEEWAAMHEKTDLLTEIANRSSLNAYLEEVKTEPQLTLTKVDIDDFKDFNLRHDRDVGDLALRFTAKKLAEIYPTDFIARSGNDEFTVVSTAQLSDDEIKETAERALSTLGSAFSSKEYTRGLTVSLGIAAQRTEEGSEQDTELLIEKSEKALYSAKKSGKAKYGMF